MEGRDCRLQRALRLFAFQGCSLQNKLARVVIDAGQLPVVDGKLIAWPSQAVGTQSEWSVQSLYTCLFPTEDYTKKELQQKASS